MPAHATITFTQPGVQDQVYVVTDMSSPPWEALEMRDSGQRTESGDTVFVRDFDGEIYKGEHQYKIRIGDGNWVVDQTRETVSDNDGNLNNVVRVEAALASSHTPFTLESTPPQQVPIKNELQEPEKEDRQDSIQFPPNIPFVTADLVPNQEQPQYGDTEPNMLSSKQLKRSADPDPDFVSVVQGPAVKSETKEVPVLVPTIHLQMVDNEPTHGDDFGDDATSAQREAHQARAADSQPDEVIVMSDHIEPADPRPDEEASANDHAEPRPYNDERHEPLSELDRFPTLPHETATSSESSNDGEPESMLLFSHEAGPDDLAHEGDEFERVLQLPHEQNFARPHPEVSVSLFGGGGPSLPHENADDAASVGEPIFKRSGSGIFIRKPSRDTMLPFVQRSYAEEEDDGHLGLEEFPTDGNGILQKVQTIASRFPEDLTEGIGAPSSPERSITSQACSDIELSSIRSHASLSRIHGDTLKEEDETESEPGSPLEMMGARGSASSDQGSAVHLLSGGGWATGRDGATNETVSTAGVVAPAPSPSENTTSVRSNNAFDKDTQTHTSADAPRQNANGSALPYGTPALYFTAAAALLAVIFRIWWDWV